MFKMNEVSVIDEGNILRLIKPLDGKTEIIFDFEKITGRELVKIKTRAQREDKDMMIPSLSPVYLAMVGAKAADMRYDDVLNLSGADFTAFTSRVSRFLNGMD